VDAFPGTSMIPERVQFGGYVGRFSTQSAHPMRILSGKHPARSGNKCAQASGSAVSFEDAIGSRRELHWFLFVSGAVGVRILIVHREKRQGGCSSRFAQPNHQAGNQACQQQPAFGCREGGGGGIAWLLQDPLRRRASRGRSFGGRSRNSRRRRISAKQDQKRHRAGGSQPRMDPATHHRAPPKDPPSPIGGESSSSGEGWTIRYRSEFVSFATEAPNRGVNEERLIPGSRRARSCPRSGVGGWVRMR